ncbi:hypothetical protein ACQ4PT_030095 [Festuca glaucescens]
MRLSCLSQILINSRNSDDVGLEDSISIEPFDLNHFFGEDGKIYGYTDLKINVWISAISLHAYAEISFKETSDGGKGITDLKPVLQNIFGENLVEKDEFLETFSKECDYISDVVKNGTPIKHDASDEDDLAVEILVLPPYQGEGHGRRLLEAINSIAESENIYDVTIEDPSDYLQYIRSSIDCLCLLTFEPIKPALGDMILSLEGTNLSFGCWEILIYLHLDSEDCKCIDNFRACIYDRTKGELLGGASGTNGKRLVQMATSFDEDSSFAVYWTKEGADSDDQTVEQQPEDLKTQEEQLNELVDNQMEEIAEVAKNVRSRGKDKLTA